MRYHDEQHLSWIRTLPCVICEDDTSTEACHIRYADASLAKPATGISIKPDDYWTVPMCGKHHREQHSMRERDFWWKHCRVAPLIIALRLFSISGDYSKGLAVLKASRI